MARTDASTSSLTSSQEAEPQRLVSMALELDVMGEPVEGAVAKLIEAGSVRWLLQTIEAAPPSPTREELGRLTSTPETLARALSVEPIDTEIVDALLNHLGLDAAPVLLDALGEVEEAHLRRLLLDRLLKLGHEVALPAVQRLSDPRWYVKRNMLTLLADLPAPTPPLPPGLLEHRDARVRREALRVLLRDPETRDPAIERALTDQDERIVRTALVAAQQGCPARAVPAVAALTTGAALEAQRVLAIRVLGACGEPSGLEALLALTAPRKGLFGSKPPPKTPEYLTALAALGGYAADPRARAIRDGAARSHDPEIAAAARGRPQ
jgi:hypothetical protein